MFLQHISTAKNKINKYIFLDLISVSAPIGLFFGRIANFINGELIGKATNGNWGVIYPQIDVFQDTLHNYMNVFRRNNFIHYIKSNLFQKKYKTGTGIFCIFIFLWNISFYI